MELQRPAWAFAGWPSCGLIWLSGVCWCPWSLFPSEGHAASRRRVLFNGLIPLCRYRANCYGWYHCYLWPGRVCFNCERLATKTTVVHWIHPARRWSVCRSCWDGCRVSVSPFFIVPGRMALINLLVLQLASSVMLVSVERHSNPGYT